MGSLAISRICSTESWRVETSPGKTTILSFPTAIILDPVPNHAILMRIVAGWNKCGTSSLPRIGTDSGKLDTIGILSASVYRFISMCYENPTEFCQDSPKRILKLDLNA